MNVQPIDLLNLRETALSEADRVMTVCNACRYCEGVCATFQAMAERRAFATADLDYLANLCHNCSACYHDCQYAPPHEFAVNVPQALAELRLSTYAEHAWPQPLARAFERNGLLVSLVTALVLALTIGLAFALQSAEVLFGVHTGPGAFYAVIGHNLMIAAAGATFGFGVFAIVIALRRYQRSLPAQPRLTLGDWWQGLGSALTLEQLSGGHGEGCSHDEHGFSHARRWSHHFTMWGFLLCFAATSVATLYHYLFGWVAPYAYTSLPVVLGTLGGVGLLVGPASQAWLKWRADPRPQALSQLGMDYAFLLLLFMVSLTGLALLAWRETAAMGVLLAVHLGFVFALFIALPYSKFIHAPLRLAALAQRAGEARVAQG